MHRKQCSEAPRASRASMPESSPARRALIIDDTDALTAVADSLLEIVETPVLWAHTAADGIEMARTWAPGIVLVNLETATTDAHGIACELRDADRGDAFFVAIADGAAAKPPTGAAVPGFDAVLERPVDAGAIVGLIERRAADSLLRFKAGVLDCGHRLSELSARCWAKREDLDAVTIGKFEAELAKMNIERLYLLDALHRLHDAGVAAGETTSRPSIAQVNELQARLDQLEARLR